MEPKIVHRDAFSVLGIAARYVDEDEEVGKLWREFMDRHHEIQVHTTDPFFYGVALPVDEEGGWAYIAGMVVEDIKPKEIPEGTEVWSIPAADYVVVEVTIDTMSDGFNYIHQEWLPASPYARDMSKPALDVYPPHATSGDAPVFLYVPLLREEAASMSQREVPRHDHKILDVPRVGYNVGDRWFFTPFAASLSACTTYLGDDYNYTYILGMSGAAFRLVWNSTKWDGGNVDVVFMAEDWEVPIRRAFEAIGRDYTVVQQEEANEVAFRERIIHAIHDEERPVMAQGIIGPPEVCIVAGYDGGGEVLIGWNFFQNDPDTFPEQTFTEERMFRKADWYKDTHSLILIQDKRPKPPLKTLDRKALAWALEVVRTPMVNEYFGGLRAYEAWAAWMQRDHDFPDDPEVLSERKMVHYDAMTMVSERGRAADFLRSMADRHPDAADALNTAADLYRQETELLERMHEVTGGFMRTEDELRRLLPSDVRQQLGVLILQARELDARASDYIERALKQLRSS